MLKLPRSTTEINPYYVHKADLLGTYYFQTNIFLNSVFPFSGQKSDSGCGGDQISGGYL